MCKALDDECLTATSNHNSSTKKRVRFRAADIHEFEKVEHDHHLDVWYSREEYHLMKLEIGEVVQAKQNGDVRCLDPNWFCWRGLEFLKLEEHVPSRKERRQRFAQHVLVFQTAVTRKTNKSLELPQPQQSEEMIRSFCLKLSQTAKETALGLAGRDEVEARTVYQECHLIYQGSDGRDRTMFGTHPPTLCRSSAATTNSGYSYAWEETGYFEDVFSYPTVFFRAIQSVGTAALLATRVR